MTFLTRKIRVDFILSTFFAFACVACDREHYAQELPKEAKADASQQSVIECLGRDDDFNAIAAVRVGIRDVRIPCRFIDDTAERMVDGRYTRIKLQLFFSPTRGFFRLPPGADYGTERVSFVTMHIGSRYATRGTHLREGAQSLMLNGERIEFVHLDSRHDAWGIRVPQVLDARGLPLILDTGRSPETLRGEIFGPLRPPEVTGHKPSDAHFRITSDVGVWLKVSGSPVFHKQLPESARQLMAFLQELGFTEESADALHVPAA